MNIFCPAQFGFRLHNVRRFFPTRWRCLRSLYSQATFVILQSDNYYDTVWQYGVMNAFHTMGVRGQLPDFFFFSQGSLFPSFLGGALSSSRRRCPAGKSPQLHFSWCASMVSHPFLQVSCPSCIWMTFLSSLVEKARLLLTVACSVHCTWFLVRSKSMVCGLS